MGKDARAIGYSPHCLAFLACRGCPPPRGLPPIQGVFHEPPKTWFITGATRGIGAEIVKATLAAGAQVVATGRDAKAVDAAFAALPAAQRDRLLALPLDVADAAQATAAVAAAQARFGRIDVLVNNAGYGQMGLFEQVDAGEVETQFATNVFGLMHVTRAVLPLMRAQRAGHVINFSSVGGVLGFSGASVYCATKFAVEGFSASLAPELAPFGIHVTVVEPGFFRTDFLKETSVRYGAKAAEGYTADASDVQNQYGQYNGKQAGDPAKLATALLEVAAAPKPPLFFAAGTDALGFVATALQQRQGDLDAWRTLTASTDIA